MLEDFYESPWHLQRLRQPPLAESISALAGRFHQLGYSRRYSQSILGVVGKFNDYVRASGIESAEEVNESLLRRFAGEEQAHRGILAAIAMRHLAAAHK